MNDQKIAELDELLKSQIDGTVDGAELNRLADLLRNDPEAQAYYVEYCQIHAMLEWEHGVLAEVAFDQTSDGVSLSSLFQRSLRRWRVLAIAASVLFVVSASWIGYDLWTRHSEPVANSANSETRQIAPVVAWETRDVLAVVSKNHGARLSVPDVALELSAGDEIRSGEYQLLNGFVELTFGNGVEVILESPARFQIQNEMRMVLHQGRLSAKVSPQGEGFTVETPSADVVDFGTEFAVEVSSGELGVDEFHVFEGEIAVNPKTNGSIKSLALHGGQATRLDHRTSTPAGIDIDFQRFIRDFDAGPLDYYDHVMKLSPDVYYAMQLDEDGQTLRDAMNEESAARIYSSDPEHLHWAPGFNGGTAFHLDGTLSETYAVAADYPKSTDDRLSVVAWVYAESRPWWGSIAKNWQHGLAPKQRGQFHFGLHELDGTLEAHINDKDDVEQFAMESIPLPLNRWQHVAMVADGSVLRLYRNGDEVAATPYNGLNGNPDIRPLAIGSKLGDSESFAPARHDSQFWDGCIDHLAIFNKALTPEQIQQLYEMGNASLEKSHLAPVTK
jgi:ferric-dicitrate binding protein FerR (iron transport regulator)